MNEYSLTRSEPRVWRVGALCRAIAQALEAGFNPVTVRGELSGFTRAASGHCYFSLKDESGQIRCAMFRRAASTLDFSPADGELVEVRGRLGVYEPRGELQLVVEGVRRAGQGALFEQFLRLKAQLESEGLFDATNKRPLPTMPRGIGVVTSLGAAALHDVVTTLQRRVPHIPTVIAPASVQGAGAPEEIIQALLKLYQLAESNKGRVPDSVSKQGAASVDVILLVRGGGAMEDLWAFNDERVARTLAQSPVPIITGVGHETDFTIADFVADVRAPTPTAAAEMVSLSSDSYLNLLAHMQERLHRAAVHRLDTQSQRLDVLASRLGRPSSRMAQRRSALALSAEKLKSVAHLYIQLKRQYLQQQRARLPEQVQLGLQRQRVRLNHAAVRLSLLDPELVLERGYAWVSTGEPEGQTVSRSQDVLLGQSLRIRLAHGRLGAKVTELE